MCSISLGKCVSGLKIWIKWKRLCCIQIEIAIVRQTNHFNNKVCLHSHFALALIRIMQLVVLFSNSIMSSACVRMFFYWINLWYESVEVACIATILGYGDHLFQFLHHSIILDYEWINFANNNHYDYTLLYIISNKMVKKCRYEWAWWQSLLWLIVIKMRSKNISIVKLITFHSSPFFFIAKAFHSRSVFQ